jgi:hypothetical protein
MQVKLSMPIRNRRGEICVRGENVMKDITKKSTASISTKMAVTYGDLAQ